MKNVLINVNKNIFLMMCLLLSLTVVISSCGDDDEMPTDPIPDPSTVVANFTAQVDADNSLMYNFTNNTVVNGITDNSFTSAWDFGDGGSSTDANPAYTYAAEGTYTVTLTATATDGETGTATQTVEVTAPKNRYASITDTEGDATGGSDTGELRIAMDSVQNGRVTFMYRVTAGPVDMDIKDAFINVSGTSTSGDDAIVEVRLKDNAPHEFREGADDAAIANANFPEGMADVWIPVEVSWAADGVSTPLFTVIIGGQTVIADAVSTTNGGDGDVPGHLAATMDGAHTIQWKYSDNGSVNDGQCHVDDIKVYSSDSGSEVVVFEDDFQARTAGDVLDPDVDENSPYHPNTMDATVAEDE